MLTLIELINQLYLSFVHICLHNILICLCILFKTVCVYLITQDDLFCINFCKVIVRVTYCVFIRGLHTDVFILAHTQYLVSWVKLMFLVCINSVRVIVVMQGFTGEEVSSLCQHYPQCEVCVSCCAYTCLHCSYQTVINSSGSVLWGRTKTCHVKVLSDVISKSYEELKREVEDRSWWKQRAS